MRGAGRSCVSRALCSYNGSINNTAILLCTGTVPYRTVPSRTYYVRGTCIRRYVPHQCRYQVRTCVNRGPVCSFRQLFFLWGLNIVKKSLSRDKTRKMLNINQLKSWQCVCSNKMKEAQFSGGDDTPTY